MSDWASVVSTMLEPASTIESWVELGAGINEDRRDDEHLRAAGGLGRIVAAVIEQEAVGLQQRLRGAAVHPDLDRLDAHIQPALEQNVDGIGQEVLPLEQCLAGHLGLDRLQQGGGVGEVVQADDGQVVGDVLRFLDQA
jgi:hypothetical protein